MIWILVGMISGSLVVSQHETREACEGRAVILKERHISVTPCVEFRTYPNLNDGSSWSISK